jgi:hypothetical protein
MFLLGGRLYHKREIFIGVSYPAAKKLVARIVKDEQATQVERRAHEKTHFERAGRALRALRDEPAPEPPDPYEPHCLMAWAEQVKGADDQLAHHIKHGVSNEGKRVLCGGECAG